LFAYLAGRGLISDEQVEVMREEINAQIGEAVAAAERHPRPTPGQLFDYVYARPPRRLQQQREELTAAADGGGS
jgi:pyruvate dehydrogenase E1 component alpha subunit